MLIDTSAWIEYFSKERNIYKDVIRNHILSGNIVFTCPVVVQEVLQGVYDKDYAKTKAGLSSAVLLSFNDPFKMAEDAARIYRTCRKNGYNIRSANDCLIALYALRYNLPLLHKDRDFNFIARVLPLKTLNDGG